MKSHEADSAANPSQRSRTGHKRQTGWRLIVIGNVLGLLSILAAGPASAYSLEGARWHGTPTSGCCATIHVQYSSAWYSGDKAAFDNARNAWNGSPANVLLDNHAGNLTVDDTSDSSVGWDGITNYNTSSGSFNYAHVLLNYYYTSGYSASTTQGVAAHELGHAMGLGHTNGCVLMTPATATRNSCGIYGPTSDDVNGINSLY